MHKVGADCVGSKNHLMKISLGNRVRDSIGVIPRRREPICSCSGAQPDRISAVPSERSADPCEKRGGAQVAALEKNHCLTARRCFEGFYPFAARARMLGIDEAQSLLREGITTMTRPIKSLWLFLLSLLGLHGVSAFAQNADVLCIPGASGDSTVVAGCIDVLSWSWGTSNSSVDGTPVNISLQDISFMKQTDSASPQLFTLLVTGKTFTAQYSQYANTCCSPTPFLTVHFSGAFLSSWQTSASSEKPTESLTLSYNAVSYCYTPSGGAAVCSAYSKTLGVIPPF